jgi:hypothetical protein
MDRVGQEAYTLGVVLKHCVAYTEINRSHKLAGTTQLVQRLSYMLGLIGIMFRFPAGVKYCVFPKSFLTGSGAHPASYSMGSSGVFIR